MFCASFVSAAVRPALADDSIKTFWEKFRAAVIKGDREAVAALTRFPVEMSYGKAKIRSRAQLARRYREVFNEQTDAARCFDKARPETEASDPKSFTVACPDAAGNLVVVYRFARTGTGWKFAALDNLNE
jgi:hypothetical protein